MLRYEWNCEFCVGISVKLAIFYIAFISMRTFNFVDLYWIWFIRKNIPFINNKLQVY